MKYVLSLLLLLISAEAFADGPGPYPYTGGGSGTLSNLVPTRILTSTGAVPSLVTDYIIVLNGPNELDLEAAPPINTTHTIKQYINGSNINIVAGTGDNIDGSSNFLFPTSGKNSINITYTSLGWIVY